MRKTTTKSLIKLGAVTAATILIMGGNPAYAGFFDGNDYYYVPTHLKFISIAVSGATGFGLGWFMSPQAKIYRRILAIAIASVMLLFALFDNGFWGLSLMPFVSILAFAIGFGYWAGEAAKRFLEPPTTFGSSEWANKDHLNKHHAIGTNGFRIGNFQHKKTPFSLCYRSDRHLLTIAPNRSGKGVSMIIPNLLKYRGSIITIDPKGENAMITAKHRTSMGQKVHVVDPWGITGLDIARINPMDWLVKGDVDMAENAMLIADALHTPTGSGGEFWLQESKALVHGIILYVATNKDEAGNRNLGRVRDLLLLDGDEFKKLFERMLQSPHHIVASTGARSLQKDEKLLANVIASAQAQTHFLDSNRIRESLSHSDFSFEDLKTEKMTIYLVLPADRLNTYGRWLRLLIQQALTINARNIEAKPEKSVLFLLDELPALGRLEMLEQAFGLMAGFGIQIWGICQDLSQLKRIYGDGWETFISNAGMIQYFGSRDRFTAEYFSALCGVTTVWNISTALSRAFGRSNGKGGLTTSDTETMSETTTGTQRQLAYPDELMRMHDNKQLVFIENMNPIIGHKTPWFKDPEFKDLGVNLHDKN
ncbi:MAG: conjugal transfer protein TraG [Hyphomicrobiales bacterium]|nr:MAG: conjugal transfer protein TraG [Hyphomicrobiales bacterium]